MERREPHQMVDAKSKLCSLEQLEAEVASLQARGLKVVFTNGCFDLLHPGHVRYLRKARAQGDVLIVALNSDHSVRRLKGEGRPIQTAGDRAEIVGALEYVDRVTIFEDDTPLEVIRRLRPDVLIKGGDWALDEIVGRSLVEEAGGQVISIGFEKGHSTTAIISRIRSRS